MGLFGKLFGKSEETEKQEQKKTAKREEIVVDGERFTVTVRNNALFIMGESIKGINAKDPKIDFRADAYKDNRFSDEYDEDEKERIQAEYVINLEYAVTDEEAFAEIISDTTPESGIEDAVFCILQEHNIIFVRDMENPAERYEESLKQTFNNAYSDWGILCTNLVLCSIEPTEEYREFYNCYRDLWI